MVAAATFGAAVFGGAISADSARKSRNAQAGATAANDKLTQQQFIEDNRRYDLNREDQERWAMMTIQGEETFDLRNRAENEKYDTLNRSDKERAYQRVRGDNAGAMGRGELAGNQLSYLMGLGPKRMIGGRAAVAGQAATAATGGTFDAAQYLADNPDIRAYDWAVADPEHHYNYYGKNEGRARPTTGGTPGREAIAAQEAVAGVEGDNSEYGRLNTRYKDFDFNFEADPGYAFRQEQGQSGVNNKFAASGNLLSGAAMKALTRFNQDYASNEYGNSYGRARSGYESDRSAFDGANMNEYNRLAGVQNAGQNAVNSTVGVSGTVQGNGIQGNYGGGSAAGGLAGASAQFAKSSDNYYDNLMSNNNARANSQSAYNNAFGNAIGGGLGMIASKWDSYQNKNTNNNNYAYPTQNAGGYDYLDF